ncbi:MAG TPA: diguanylate cyclase [Gemmatimonadales bacterium]|nr:diguanylate cyclase [Gemmatimonadales bacterium]
MSWAQTGRGTAPASPVQWVRRALAERISPELRRDAVEDPLTGALNRRADRVATARALIERREGSRVLRLLADLDNFKMLNDLRGHAAGDRALCVVRGALERATRAFDVVSLARPGGDEFTLTLRVAPTADPAAIRDRIEQTVNHALTRAGLHYAGRRRIGISIGVAEASGPTTLEALDAVADDAARRRKRARGVSAPRSAAPPRRGGNRSTRPEQRSLGL